MKADRSLSDPVLESKRPNRPPFVLGVAHYTTADCSQTSNSVVSRRILEGPAQCRIGRFGLDTCRLEVPGELAHIIMMLPDQRRPLSRGLRFYAAAVCFRPTLASRS